MKVELSTWAVALTTVAVWVTSGSWWARAAVTACLVVVVAVEVRRARRRLTTEGKD